MSELSTMDEKKRQLRRTAAEEFMRSLEQLGELLNAEESAPHVAADPDPGAKEDDTDEDETLTNLFGEMFPPGSEEPAEH